MTIQQQNMCMILTHFSLSLTVQKHRKTLENNNDHALRICVCIYWSFNFVNSCVNIDVILSGDSPFYAH